MFLDSDDYWDGITILSDLEKIILEHKPDVIFNYMSSVYQDRIINHYLKVNTSNGNFRSNFSKLYDQGVYAGFACTKILKRKIIMDNHLIFIKDRLFEDIPWSFSLVRHIKNYAVYQKCFYMYRRDRKESISHFVSLKNQKSLFKNLYSVKYEANIIREKDQELYKSTAKYLDDIYQYVMHCYDLLSENDKKKLFYIKNEYLDKWNNLKHRW